MASRRVNLGMRQPHRKSRFGCHQCKQRKVKCDEAKPTCQRCVASGRHCSYLTSLQPSRPASLAAPIPSPDSLSPAASLQQSISSERSIGHVSAADDPHIQVHGSLLVAERYSLFHLELFDHLKNHLIGVTQCSQPSIARMLQIACTEGLREPYLMDQLLALAAAHKSTTTVTGEQKHLYRTESTKLQNRALAQVGLDQRVVTEHNSLALFAYSTALGQHVLFDVFSPGADLSTTLDQLVQCFDLHQGIRVTAGKAWEKIHATLHNEGQDDQIYTKTNDQITTTGTDCDGLLRRLRCSGLDQKSLNVYDQTVHVLQYLFDSVHSSHARRAVVVHEWPVRISNDYVTLLRQRRPEALVVLAYYAVLLHFARDHWAVGDSGRRLIQSISKHLGDYWADWLVWPKQALEDG